MSDIGRPTKALPTLSPEAIARFWGWVKKGATNECWPWLGGHTDRGRPIFSLNNKSLIASRVAFKLQHGIDPHPLHVLHHCDNPSCCNGLHLFCGTQHTNRSDMLQKGRQAKRFQIKTTKLTDAQLEQMLDDVKHGRGFQYEIAQRYNVSKSLVSGYVTGTIQRSPLS